MSKIFFPSEWHPQSALQLTWPHEATDWATALDEVIPCFVAITKEVIKRENVLIICADANKVREQLRDFDERRIIFREIKTNDTWARDHGGITVFRDDKPVVYDFTFNGWGMKFPANYDNLITRELFRTHTFLPDVTRINMAPFVLEGGSVESNGKGVLMTTIKCLLSSNRNSHLNLMQLNFNLMHIFGAEKILWLNNGRLEGDDTDGHIDTLARFCDEDTIAYVQCTDRRDTHYDDLQAMEKELQTFRTCDDKPYRLIPLPMADAVIEDGQRLPATYANFTIINGAVLMPFYGSAKDGLAQGILQSAFPDREVVGVNCRPLLRQHGSLHCVTMQYPEGIIKDN